MKRTDRVLQRLGSRGKFAASALFAWILVGAAASPVGAWTLLKNNFGSDPDNPGTPNSCTDVSPYWCITWPLDSGHSSSVYVFLAASLVDQSGETIDFKQQARNAFGRWNSVPAYSPFLYEATNESDSSGYADGCATAILRASLPVGVIAKTYSYSKYDLLGSGSKNRYDCFVTILATGVLFDANSNPDDGFVDARWTLGHELGHGLALGHTAKAALMYPVWPNSKYMGITPATNDIAGLQAAYGNP